jgi:hypothetical protein
MAIKINNDTVIDNNKNINAGIITATDINVPPSPLTFSPTDGATDVSGSTTIIIGFNRLITKGTGNITLRSGSAGGTILQTIAVTSASVTISGAEATITPPSVLPTSTNVFVVVDAGAFISISDSKIINTYSFTTETLALGDSYQGGFLICFASPTRWVVAPNTSEVSRDWYCRNDANTRAQQVSGCTGWFVPTIQQLQNPGYTCRTFWDSFSSACYWSSTPSPPASACSVNFTCGAAVTCSQLNTYCVRSFRCVTY